MSLFDYYLDLLRNYIVNYIDIDYSLWLTWCLSPLVVTFLLPVIIVILLYVSALMAYICKLHRTHLTAALRTGDKWEVARRLIGILWDSHGRIWHGYDVQGFENLPDSGPILFIYYHLAIPIDIYYFIARIYLTKNKLIHSVADYFLFKIPGFTLLTECLNIIPGTVQSCSKLLKEGHYLTIAPGGVYESQFSVNYSLMWKNRMGFAKAAIDSKAPIVPIFTENGREAFRTVGFAMKIFLKLYAWTRIPLTPIYGGFPVKMTTHIGKPIYYDPQVSPEELRKKVEEAMEDLIKTHQRLPGNIRLSLLERIPYLRKRLHRKSSAHNE